jgi:glycosyltransferase involved in cell wall biosynthesis
MNKIEISIVIATRHREEILWESVEKAYLAIKDKNAEIIVVNDGDTEIDVPLKLQDKIVYLNNPKRGVASARNLGALHAKGNTLFFLDDDMWLNKEAIDWIHSFIINGADKKAVYNINWEYPPKLSENLKHSKIGHYLLNSCYHTMWGRMHQSGQKPIKGFFRFDHAMSGALVLSKDVFIEIGQYNEAMIFQGEDIDLTNKLNKVLIPIYCVFDVTLHHNQQDRLEINSFLKRDAKGFASEFNAVKSQFIKPNNDIHYKGIKKILFDIFSRTEKMWMLFLKMTPNQTIFIPANNKLIGALASLQRYKQWKKILG